MGFEFSDDPKAKSPKEESLEQHPIEDTAIPEGTFFAASSRKVENMTVADAVEYADFFSFVLQASSHYSEEEKKISIELHTSEKNAERIADKNWILLTVREEESGKMIGSLEARLITNNLGEHFGNITWTLAHPDYRRQGIGMQLKLQSEDFFRERGCVGVISVIKDSNIASIEMNRTQGILRDDFIPRPKSGAAWYTKRFKPESNE